MSVTKIKFDFGWGNPYFLLDILSFMYVGDNRYNIHDMNYGPYDGNPELIRQTHEVIAKTTGQKYNHIIITNGASGAINLILRRFKAKGGTTVFTTQYGYPSYDSFIERAGLERYKDIAADNFSFGFGNRLNIRLIDSPENPLGTQYTLGNKDTDIWDGVYHNKIYTKNTKIIPDHRMFVGSYSKLLGIAGARIGFIATDDSLLYEDLKIECKAEYTGVSKPSQTMVSHILKSINLDDFMSAGHRDLCYNKEEFQKIEYLFDGQEVGEVGMFYCVKADPKAVQLLDRVGIGYVVLDKDTIRLSMGQHLKTTKQGIREILKGDGK
jgi:aspartate/methionine/tyrosine aminotransferase